MTKGMIGKNRSVVHAAAVFLRGIQTLSVARRLQRRLDLVIRELGRFGKHQSDGPSRVWTGHGRARNTLVSRLGIKPRRANFVPRGRHVGFHESILRRTDAAETRETVRGGARADGNYRVLIARGVRRATFWTRVSIRKDRNDPRGSPRSNGFAIPGSTLTSTPAIMTRVVLGQE